MKHPDTLNHEPLMHRALNEVKIRAKRLHRACRQEQTDATVRVAQQLPGLHKDSDNIQLKHCQQAIARELGFKEWHDCQRLLSGQARPGRDDMGVLFHHPRCDALLNHWFAHYPQAALYRQQAPHLTLLPYKRQFVVVTRDYLAALALDEALVQQAGADLVSSYPGEYWDQLALAMLSR